MAASLLHWHLSSLALVRMQLMVVLVWLAISGSGWLPQSYRVCSTVWYMASQVSAKPVLSALRRPAMIWPSS